jgi:hypothetical protein
MTYAEVLRLPRSTPVRAPDGHIGRLVSWYHSAETVAIHLDGDGLITIPASALRRAADGTVEFVPE